jgi:DNA polymerase-3 subunit alpha
MNKLEKYFVFKCRRGLAAKIKEVSYEVDEEAYRQQLEYEMDIILKMGFPGYFLIVQDFINWAKQNDILVGPARGSAAGSLACWALGITGRSVDPMIHGLFFERFLNPHRISMPDIDVDFPKDKRDRVIEYVRQKFGNDHVAQIGTFGTFKAKAAIRGVARTLSIPLSVADKLCKMYPKPEHGKDVPLAKAYEHVRELREFRDAIHTQEGQILRWAEKIEGRVASFGIHASGVVISAEPLAQTVPLARGKRDEVVTQWDMNNVEEVGLIKFDFLGLKTLTMMSTCIDLIQERTGEKIDLDDIDLEDEQVYSNLRKGDNIGLFQLEASGGMRDLMIKIRPTSIADLSALVAMYRPGPLASPKMPEYLAWRAGEMEPSYHHPDLSSVLKETGGWIVYQEQVLQIARDLAGYSLGEADLLRRAVGKKKEKEMIEHHEKFVEGMVSSGYTEGLAETLWLEILAFADYGFNKSHAVAYGIISYWSAWLKTHYPVEFMAAALTCDSGNKDQIIVYLQECKAMGIQVLPPDVNESGTDFSPIDGAIRFGFSAVKNLGTTPAKLIAAERKENGPYKDIFDFAERIDLGQINKRKLESLVLSGAFDFTGKTRATLIAAVDSILDHKAEMKKYESKMNTYRKKLTAYDERLEAIDRGELSSKGKPLKPLKQPEAPVEPDAPSYIDLPEMNSQRLMLHEKELTGFFISGHPLQSFAARIARSNSTIQYLKEERPDYIEMVCLISELSVRETRAKKRMAYGRLEDLTGTSEMIIFPNVYNRNKDNLMENVPVLIRAKVEYTEADVTEADEWSITDAIIPRMIVQSVKILQKPIDEDKEMMLVLPLMASKIEQVKQIIDKYAGNHAKVSIRLSAADGSILTNQRTFGINDNVRSFRTEVYKVINS